LFLDFAGDASLEDVLAAVKIVYKNTGCGPCGRLSLLIKADERINPAERELQEIGSLKSVLEMGDVAEVKTMSGGR